MKQANKKSQECLWEDCDRFCRLLENSGIPLESDWPYLILYLRGLKTNKFLSEVQKSSMQELLVSLFQRKDFSEKSYEEVSSAVHNVFVTPYENKMIEVVRAASALTTEVCTVLGKQKAKVQSVSDDVEAELARGATPDSIISSMRNALKSVVAEMERDTLILQTLSYKDSLTGLGNRHSFDKFMDKAVKEFLEEEVPLALIIFDIDFFKKFNDDYGHLVGDQVLRTLARQVERLVSSLKATDDDVLAARYGGEEFAVILQGEFANRAHRLAEQLRIRISEASLRLRDASGVVVADGIQVTVSVGVAFMSSDWKAAHASNLIDFADRALYSAKRDGRNCSYAYNPKETPPYVRIPTLEK